MEQIGHIGGYRLFAESESIDGYIRITLYSTQEVSKDPVTKRVRHQFFLTPENARRFSLIIQEAIS
jgi:hypothetical protein